MHIGFLHFSATIDRHPHPITVSLAVVRQGSYLDGDRGLNRGSTTSPRVMFNMNMNRKRFHWPGGISKINIPEILKKADQVCHPKCRLSLVKPRRLRATSVSCQWKTETSHELAGGGYPSPLSTYQSTGMLAPTNAANYLLHPRYLSKFVDTIKSSKYE